MNADKWRDRIFCGVFVPIIVIVVFHMTMRVMGATYPHGYRDGQIDALTGKVKYELVEQPNGETRWQEIEK